MDGWLRLCNTVYWLALSIWAGVLIAAGVSAVSAFTTLPDEDLGVRLEKFAAYDRAEHGRIAAGHVMEPIFTFVDLMQFLCAFFVIVTLALQLTIFRMPWKRLGNLVRMIAIVLTAALLIGRAAFITPEMNRDLRAYWSAAEAGEVEQARAHHAAFDVNHRRAEPMFNASLVLILIAIGTSAAALSPSTGRPNASRLETPALARK